MCSDSFKQKMRGVYINIYTLHSHQVCKLYKHHSCNCLWWVDLGWLPDPHLDALLLPLLNTAGGDTKMDKLIG